MAIAILLTTLMPLVMCRSNHVKSDKMIEKSAHFGSISRLSSHPKHGSIETPQQTREYPCPDAEAILPCVCFYNESDIDISCNNVTAEDLSRVFQQEFPVKEINRLSIGMSPLLSILNFDLNGVTIKDLNVFIAPITEISPEFLSNSSSTLQIIYLQDTQLTTEGFPFETLQDYQVLLYLYIQSANLQYIPKLVSSSLAELSIYYTNISTITPGMSISLRLILF